MISNYVLIFGSTTFNLSWMLLVSLWIDFKLCSYFWFDNAKALVFRSLRLWIDFKLCSYFWFDNIHKNVCVWRRVVNWFQIMFLFLVRQLYPRHWHWKNSCELISNYVLIFGSTTEQGVVIDVIQLWIDFKLCSYFWFDNTINLC